VKSERSGDIIVSCIIPNMFSTKSNNVDEVAATKSMADVGHSGLLVESTKEVALPCPEY